MPNEDYWPFKSEREANDYNRWLDEDFFASDPETQKEITKYTVAQAWYVSIPDNELDKLAYLGTDDLPNK